MINLKHCVLSKNEDDGNKIVCTRESANHPAPSMQAYLCAMIANNAIYRMMVENRNRKGIEQK